MHTSSRSLLLAATLLLAGTTGIATAQQAGDATQPAATSEQQEGETPKKPLTESEAAPATQQPAADAATGEQPAAQEQTTETPAATEPTATEQPAAQEQTAQEPSAAPADTSEQPATTQEQPTATEQTAPAQEQPATTEQAAPATEQPAATEQAAPAPEQPTTTEQAAPAQEQPAAPEQQAAPAAQEAEEKVEETAAPAPAPAQPETSAAPAPSETAPAPAPAAAAAQPQAAPAPEATAPVTVVKEDQTAAEREALAQAEKERRADKRRRRAELIGAGLAGVAVGAIIAGSQSEVVGDEGDRLILRDEDGRVFVRRDENALLRADGSEVFTEDLDEGRQRTTVTRPDGTEIVTLRDEFGNILTRTKRFPNGDEVVLIDNRDLALDAEPIDDLGPLEIAVARDVYIVDAAEADADTLEETLTAAPVERVERAYSLREIRDNQRLRAKLRRIDLTAINFQTGSATVTPSQVGKLDGLAASLNAAIRRDPSEVFLIEGHTDAVGDEITNLTLSDRRAETVARILIDVYGVPAENLVVEGYGESDLKVATEAANAENRRVTLRRITPLLRAG